MNLIKSPSPSTIDRKANNLNEELFKNGQYYYHNKDIVKLLNKLGGYSEVPNEDNLLWGDCISTCINIKNMISSLGIGGSDILQVTTHCFIDAPKHATPSYVHIFLIYMYICIFILIFLIRYQSKTDLLRLDFCGLTFVCRNPTYCCGELCELLDK